MYMSKGFNFSEKYNKLFIYFTSIIIFMPFLIFSVWSISYGFIAGYIGFMVIIVGLFYIIRQPKWSYLMVLLSIWFAVNISMMSNTASILNKTNDFYFSMIKSGHGLSMQEKLNVYGLNIVMAVMAYPIFPEVAKETLLMMFPVEGNVRTFNDGFFMKSAKIRKALKKNSLQKEIYVSWNASEYLHLFTEARSALALNACTIRKFANGDVTAEVKVTYPAESRTLLIPFPSKVYLQEGLLNYLQTEGWLFPYKAIWTFEKN